MVQRLLAQSAPSSFPCVTVRKTLTKRKRTPPVAVILMIYVPEGVLFIVETLRVRWAERSECNTTLGLVKVAEGP